VVTLNKRLADSLKRIEKLSAKRFGMHNATRKQIIKANVLLDCECEERDRILKEMGKL
jgi:hypothetical protein